MLKAIVGFVFAFVVASAGSYQVRLGEFGSYEAVNTSIAQIQEERYKEKLSIEQEGESFFIYSKPFESVLDAQNALSIYKQTFQDACMVEDGVVAEVEEESVVEPKEVSAQTASLWQSVQTSTPNNTPHKVTSTEEVLDKPVLREELSYAKTPQHTPAQEPVSKPKKKISFAQALKRQIFYLCYEGKAQGGRPKPVVKAVFSGSFIAYSSEMMEIPPIVTPYRLINDDLHVTVGMFSVGSTKSRLVKVTDTYLRTINWADGKSVPAVRFYYNQRDALAFVRNH